VLLGATCLSGTKQWGILVSQIEGSNRRQLSLEPSSNVFMVYRYTFRIGSGFEHNAVIVAAVSCARLWSLDNQSYSGAGVHDASNGRTPSFHPLFGLPTLSTLVHLFGVKHRHLRRGLLA
jgi:hypothetical protein